MLAVFGEQDHRSREVRVEHLRHRDQQDGRQRRDRMAYVESSAERSQRLRPCAVRPAGPRRMTSASRGVEAGPSPSPSRGARHTLPRPFDMFLHQWRRRAVRRTAARRGQAARGPRRLTDRRCCRGRRPGCAAAATAVVRVIAEPRMKSCRLGIVPLPQLGRIRPIAVLARLPRRIERRQRREIPRAHVLADVAAKEVIARWPAAAPPGSALRARS